MTMLFGSAELIWNCHCNERTELLITECKQLTETCCYYLISSQSWVTAQRSRDNCWPQHRTEKHNSPFLCRPSSCTLFLTYLSISLCFRLSHLHTWYIMPPPFNGTFYKPGTTGGSHWALWTQHITRPQSSRSVYVWRGHCGQTPGRWTNTRRTVRHGELTTHCDHDIKRHVESH